MTAPAEDLIRDRSASVSVARPIFQVLLDDAQQCTCHLWADDGLCTPGAVMRVTAADYDSDRRFL